MFLRLWQSLRQTLPSPLTQVYEFSSGSNDWVQIGSTLNGDAVGDEFGTAVALSADGTVLAVGASSNDAGGNVNSGHVKGVLGASAPTMSRSKPHVSHTHCCSHMTSVFEYASGTWSQRGSSIVGSEANELFGGSLSLNVHGTVVAIGGPGYSTGSSGRAPRELT